MAQLFINYRARVHAGYALLLDRVLTEHFGADAVFRDQRSLHPGEDFVAGILGGLRRSFAVLAVIGPTWPDGPPDGDEDWVVAELAVAFAWGIRVVPVLVDGARVPMRLALPAMVSALARCQAMPLRGESADADLAAIVAWIGRLLLVGVGGCGDAGVDRPSC